MKQPGIRTTRKKIVATYFRSHFSKSFSVERLASRFRFASSPLLLGKKTSSLFGNGQSSLFLSALFSVLSYLFRISFAVIFAFGNGHNSLFLVLCFSVTWIIKEKNTVAHCAVGLLNELLHVVICNYCASLSVFGCPFSFFG